MVVVSWVGYIATTIIDNHWVHGPSIGVHGPKLGPCIQWLNCALRDSELCDVPVYLHSPAPGLPHAPSGASGLDIYLTHVWLCECVCARGVSDASVRSSYAIIRKINNKGVVALSRATGEQRNQHPWSRSMISL